MQIALILSRKCGAVGLESMTVTETNEFAGEFVSEVIISAEREEDAAPPCLRLLLVWVLTPPPDEAAVSVLM